MFCQDRDVVCYVEGGRPRQVAKLARDLRYCLEGGRQPAGNVSGAAPIACLSGICEMPHQNSADGVQMVQNRAASFGSLRGEVL